MKIAIASAGYAALETIVGVVGAAHLREESLVSEIRPTIWIETVDERARGPQSGRAEKLVEAMPERFEALGRALSEAADRFWQGLVTMERAPQDVEMELNVGVEAGGEWLILRGKAHASATVKLVWRRGPDV